VKDRAERCVSRENGFAEEGNAGVLAYGRQKYSSASATGGSQPEVRSPLRTRRTRFQRPRPEESDNEVIELPQSVHPYGLPFNFTLNLTRGSRNPNRCLMGWLQRLKSAQSVRNARESEKSDAVLIKLATPGLDLLLDEKNFRLYCEGREVKANLRTLATEARSCRRRVRAERYAKPSQAIQYYMFRGAEKASDKKLFTKPKCRSTSPSCLN